MKMVKKNFFLVFGLIGLGMWALVSILGLGYDDGGIRGIVWWVAQFFAIPYLLIGEVLAKFPDVFGAMRNVVLILLGLLMCASIDFAIRKFRQGK